jgi:tight adherence protein C
VLQARTGLARRARLEPATAGSLDAAPRATAISGLFGGVRRLGGQNQAQDPTQVSALRNKLMQAGFTSREAVAYYLGARSIALIAATIATLMVIPLAFSHTGLGAMMVAGFFALVAVLGPDQVLRMRRTAREREYRDGFPDLLDLLVASVQAGLSLDAAVSRIGEELGNRYPNLSDHLLLMTLELRAGRARKDAWSRLADRLGIDEARSFATMLRQAEDMGTSLGETLSAFSEDMRAKRILRAEELASSLPAKLMLPLILFIFPCLMGVLILPAAIHISQAFHH